MNTFKKHISLIIPLLALLFSLQSIILVNRAIVIKEDKLSQSYSILLASEQNLDFNLILRNIKEAKSLDEINPDFLLQKIQQNMTEASIKEIKQGLPFFYSLKLSIFPDEKKLASINSILSKIPSVVKIETFSKTHNQVYRLLYFIKINIWIFGSLITILSIILLIRQIQIWRFEHIKRMEIMTFLGARAWIKNGILFQLAVIDSIITSILITLGTFYLSIQSNFKELLNVLEIQNNIFSFGNDFVVMLVFSICVSVICVFIVIFSQRRA